jgi:hypothetical protein
VWVVEFWPPALSGMRLIGRGPESVLGLDFVISAGWGYKTVGG